MGNETEDRQAGGLIGVPIRLPGGLVLLLHLFISLDDGSATILSNNSHSCPQRSMITFRSQNPGGRTYPC